MPDRTAHPGVTKAAPPARKPESATGEGSAVVRRSGRPSKADAEQLAHRIVDAASDLFFTLGYGATTIEAVAQRAGISKRTFYHRFENKSALFGAVVHRTIERLRPPANVRLIRGNNLAEVLHGLAMLILHAALSPPAIALHRLIIGESGRFPDLATAVANEGASEEGVRLIAGLLDRATQAGKLAIDNSTFAAEQFLHMLVAGPQRRAMGIGVPMSPAEIDAWVSNVVNLFLNGCRGWQSPTNP